MSQHDLVSAWNHGEDVVAVSPLTINVCTTHQETFSFKHYLQHNYRYVSTICEVTSSMSLGEMVGQFTFINFFTCKWTLKTVLPCRGSMQC